MTQSIYTLDTDRTFTLNLDDQVFMTDLVKDFNKDKNLLLKKCKPCLVPKEARQACEEGTHAAVSKINDEMWAKIYSRFSLISAQRDYKWGYDANKGVFVRSEYKCTEPPIKEYKFSPEEWKRVSALDQVGRRLIDKYKAEGYQSARELPEADREAIAQAHKNMWAEIEKIQPLVGEYACSLDDVNHSIKFYEDEDEIDDVITINGGSLPEELKDLIKKLVG